MGGPGSEVPDAFVVVRGGEAPLPPPGTTFSGAAGIDAFDAARGVPHGKIRTTTARAIRAHGGRVAFAPEPTREGNINHRHVNITEGASGAFGAPEANPVPKEQRIK
jgi:hypothetical protein